MGIEKILVGETLDTFGRKYNATVDEIVVDGEVSTNGLLQLEKKNGTKIDILIPKIPNSVLSGCELTVTDIQATVQPGEWQINGVSYQKSTATFLSIDPLADIALNRIDAVVGNTFASFQIIKGVEAENPATPSLGLNRVLIGYIFINADGPSLENPQDLSNYYTKAEANSLFNQKVSINGGNVNSTVFSPADVTWWGFVSRTVKQGFDFLTEKVKEIQTALLNIYTKAEVDALTYTDEKAQDAVGGALTSQFTYIDGSDSIDLSDTVAAQVFNTVTHDFTLEFNSKGRLIAFTKTPKDTTPNIPPSVSAGSDQTLSPGTTSVNLSGSASDSDGIILSTAWTQISGPNTGSITSPTSLSTTVTGLIAGTYIFRLTATDNETASVYDDVQITIGTNAPPTVYAGADQSLSSVTTSTSLSGSATDSDGSITSTVWSRISGPNTPTIGSPSSLTTSVTGLVNGTYVFRLTATDNLGATAYDDVQVVVAENAAPVVTDVQLLVPNNAAVIGGSITAGYTYADTEGNQEDI